MNKQLQQYILDRIIINLDSDCWNWTKSKDKYEYGAIGPTKWYKLYHKSKAHQLSYIAFNGVYPKELHVLHKCNNRSCCNPDHLYIGTNADNMRDRILDGTSNKGKTYNNGERQGNSKLTSSDIRYIKVLLTTMKQKDIAAMFGVDRRTISDINTGRLS